MAKMILVVDDDAQVLDVVVKHLLNNGFEAMGVMTGKSGLEKAKSYLPDLILLDIMLPDLEGSEVARELQQQERVKNIPIIFLSGMIGKDKEVDEIRVGDITYPAIGKPFTGRQLLEAVKKTFNLV
ncbi:MAG: response regulator [Candidatus Omnitrophica bacterium]|nr:response regulator [Candidatus Omnitrophota bacterium]